MLCHPGCSVLHVYSPTTACRSAWLDTTRPGGGGGGGGGGGDVGGGDGDGGGGGAKVSGGGAKLPRELRNMWASIAEFGMSQFSCWLNLEA